jgi:hypothetical protein
MIRRLFTFAAAASMLAFILLSAAITWGTVAPTEFVWARWGSLWQLTIGRGSLLIARVEPWPRDEPAVRTGEGHRLVVRLAGPLRSNVGFVVGGTGTGTARVGTGSAGRVADADPWGHAPPLAPAHLTTFWLSSHRSLALAAVLPALWAWRRSRRRWRPGLCRVCLYDLRGSSERCPECGTPIRSDAERTRA